MENHYNLLLGIAELNKLFSESINVESFLKHIVDLIAHHMKADVCSVYLYNGESNELVLKSTCGLNPESINSVTLKPGEGIVGQVFEANSPVCEKCATDNPLYKHFSITDENSNDALLAIPLVIGKSKIGVMSVQKKHPDTFNDNDVLALNAVCSQLSSMIANIKMLIYKEKDINLSNEKKNIEYNKLLKGKSASTGLAISEVFVLKKNIYYDKQQLKGLESIYTVSDFYRAIKETETQLKELQEKVEEKLSDAATLIFDAHLLMLKDKGLIKKIEDFIDIGMNPPIAVLETFNQYKKLFSKSDNPIIKEKVEDMTDLCTRIIDNIINENQQSLAHSDKIVIAEDLFPSDLLKLSAEGIKGVVLVRGGVTSHISILARSLKVPMAIVNIPELLKLTSDTTILLDAGAGNIFINPDDEIKTNFEEKVSARKTITSNSELIQSDTVTEDNKKIKLMANINLLSDLENLKECNIDGIGLYRTEFPFIIRNSFPSEQEQFVLYEKLLTRFPDKPVTFRTLDIGGDKVLSYYSIPDEENPFLGMRSIRFTLAHKEVFKTQIRAILRAGVNRKIKIMFPMISSVDELIECKRIVEECKVELLSKNIDYATSPEIGIMIEIPSTILIIDELAKEADFLSIGSNDLVQYTLAVDRTNEKVAHLYNPAHPAILKSLKKITDAAHKNNIEVSLCGDMARDTKYLEFLIGIGPLTLSVNSVFIPEVKQAIREISTEKAVERANHILSLNRIRDLKKEFKLE